VALMAMLVMVGLVVLAARVVLALRVVVEMGHPTSAATVLTVATLVREQMGLVVRILVTETRGAALAVGRIKTANRTGGWRLELVDSSVAYRRNPQALLGSCS